MVNVEYNDSGDLVWNTAADGAKSVYNIGDVSWVLSATGNVFVMAAGVGFFYSGLLRRRNALSALYMSMSTVAVVTLQWFLWGFTLSFSDTGSVFIGDMKYVALTNIGLQPPLESSRIPLSLYCVYELMFAATTTVIAVGAFAERGRLGPILIFVFLWSTIVYDPIACWTWNSRAWGRKIGVLDFAGGIAVHICSGASALATSVYLRPRYQYSPDTQWAVNNITSVVLGTVLMWYGWFGFNGGSALSANFIAIQALLNTNISAAAGGLTGVLMDYKIQKRWGSVSFCSGVVAGLITITPGSGYVSAPAALLFGILGGCFCNLASRLRKLGYDDSLDIFATHGIGGLVGSLLTGIFAQSSVYSLSGPTSDQRLGWLDGNWKQVPIQLAASVAAMVWSFGWTFLILKLMSRLSFTKIRASKEAQDGGLDENQMGEDAFDLEEFPSSQEVNRQILQSVAQLLGPQGNPNNGDAAREAEEHREPHEPENGETDSGLGEEATPPREREQQQQQQGQQGQQGQHPHPHQQQQGPAPPVDPVRRHSSQQQQ